MIGIDAVFSCYKQLFKLPAEIRYRPAQAVTSVDYYEMPGSQTITLVFAPWGNSRIVNSGVAKRLTQQGSSYLQINLNDLILHSDPKIVEDSFQQAAERMIKEVVFHKVYKKFKTINLLGISLGSVILSLSAEQLERFDRVTLVVPGSELATAFWSGMRTRRLSNTYRKRGFQLAQLRKQWRLLAPINHLSVLAGHSIAIILATGDQYVPYVTGHELVEAMSQAGLSPQIITVRGGHVSTLLRFSLGDFKHSEC